MLIRYVFTQGSTNDCHDLIHGVNIFNQKNGLDAVNSKDLKISKRSRRQPNEIQVLQEKLHRPLNSVEIDRLYKGYRKIDKCTKRKDCQCYHCNLLRSSDESASSDASDVSSTSVDSEFTIACLKSCSSNRDAQVVPENHPLQKSFMLPQGEYSSRGRGDASTLFWKIEKRNFSEKNKATEAFDGRCGCRKLMIYCLLSIVYFFRWVCIITTSFMCQKFCRRRTRRILPVVHEKISPPTSPLDKSNCANMLGAKEDNGEVLVSVAIHSPS